MGLQQMKNYPKELKDSITALARDAVEGASK